MCREITADQCPSVGLPVQPSAVISESSFYFSTTCAAGALAFMLGLHWRRNGGLGGIGYWTFAALLFAVSNLGLFIGHENQWPTLVLLARTTLAIAYGSLLLGAQGSVGLKPGIWTVVAVLGLNALLSATVLAGPDLYYVRVILSRLVWGGFCLLAYRILRQANHYFWDSAAAPAKILLYQGLYLLVRAAMIGYMWPMHGVVSPPWLVALDSTTAVIFDVMLFVGLLMTHHQLRSDELAATRIELQTVSGLLPICSWCQKVRDDEGYWHDLHAYLKHSAAGRITHGICHHCSDRMGGSEPPMAASPGSRPVCQPARPADKR